MEKRRGKRGDEELKGKGVEKGIEVEPVAGVLD